MLMQLSAKTLAPEVPKSGIYLILSCERFGERYLVVTRRVEEVTLFHIPVSIFGSSVPKVTKGTVLEIIEESGYRVPVIRQGLPHELKAVDGVQRWTGGLE